MQSDLAHVVFVVFDFSTSLNNDIIFVNSGIVDRLEFDAEYGLGLFVDGFEFEGGVRKVDFAPGGSLVRMSAHPLFLIIKK